ncbi:MAG TPA: trigger factor [Thermoanaerobaculia bacterium]|nr:trigger factor [Thermoanaerobaculia bacterium]
MSVVVSLQDVGPCRKQLTVEVPAPAVEAETERVVQEYGKSVRIPGFRKGKVPTHLVRRRFAKDIEREVVDRLLPRYWKQAQAEASIDPLLPPEVDEVADLQPGEPLKFVATVETRPQIELRNTRDFDLPDPPVEPGTLEVDETLENLRRQLGEWVPVERAASRGDMVSIEITEMPGDPDPHHHGEPEPAEPRTDAVQVEVGDPNVWEELSLALSGLSEGQETTFTRHEAAVQHGDHEHPARDRRFRVRVTAVKERELPAVDDEFASRVSPEFTTLDGLREAVTAQLRNRKTEERQDKRREALLTQLRERHPLELPERVVEREVEVIVNNYAENLHRRGIDLNRAGIDWGRVQEDAKPLGERRVHERLLLDAIAEAENIHVSEEEFERLLAALARSQGTTTPALRRALDEDGRLTSYRNQMRREKVVRRLLGEPDETVPATALDAGADV